MVGGSGFIILFMSYFSSFYYLLVLFLFFIPGEGEITLLFTDI